MDEVDQNSQNAFAVIGRVCQNNMMPDSWRPVSRNDLILRLRELPVMTTEATIVEEVVFQSPHVRLAQFRVPTRCHLIPKLRDRLMRGIQDYHVVEGTKENHFCMALEEALTMPSIMGIWKLAPNSRKTVLLASLIWLQNANYCPPGVIAVCL